MAVAAISTGACGQGFRYEPARAAATTPAVQDASQQQPVVEPERPRSGFRKENLELGGTFGFGISGDYTSINVSPQVGYRFNPYFSAGAGVGYNYYKVDGFYSDYTSNYFGFNLYGRVNPIRYITLQLQPEIYRVWGRNIDTRIVYTALVGGGITVPAGRSGGISVMAYYDLVQDEWSPYGSEVFFSLGYVYGF